MTIKAKILNIDNDNIKFDRNIAGYKPGQWVEIKTVRPLSMEADILQRLQSLWYLLLKSLVEQTGYSQQFWKKELKSGAGFFVSIKEPDNNVTRELKSVGGECTLKELSSLFTYSFYWILENEIINLGDFQQRYFEIKGKELISFIV